MHRPTERLLPAASALVLALLIASCGASTEPKAETFYTEHSGEAARASRAVARLEAALAALPSRPTRANLEALAVDAQAARRPLLAAARWTVTESEEAGVSQAERELNEAAGALLRATTAVRQYADTGNQAALARYRFELRGGRERWNQGLLELWHVARRRDPPRI